MKTIIFLLAALCSVFADHHEGQMDPCLVQCKEQTTTKLGADPQLANFKPDTMTSPEGRTKMRAFIRGYVSGTGAVPAAIGSPELWAKLCTISTEAETCINACPDSPKKEGAKKFLALFKLGCDEDFKAKVGCLVDVNKERSEACTTKCQPLATKLTEFLTQRDAAPTEVVHASKEVSESGCKFVNCRLNCRKTDIVNKCQDAGFEQAKKLTSAVAQSAKMLYKRHGGDLANWPEFCHSDKIIEAHEY
jgi:hypothetical protein